MIDGSSNWNRRRALKALGVGIGTASLAGCSGGDGGDGDDGGGTTTTQATTQPTTQATTMAEPTQIHSIEPEGSTDIPAILMGLQRGVWEAKNIDLSFEVAAFGKFIRQIQADISQIAGISIPPMVQLRALGEDISFVGIAQDNFQNHMMSRADDDSIEGPTDLGEKVLGLPGENSTTTHAQRAMILDEYDFDILEDTKETRFSSPPVLFNLLMEGEIDAISEFQGFVISGLGSGQAKTIFNPYTFWQEKTGFPPAVAIYAARESWVRENAEACRNFLLGWEESTELLKNNPEEGIQNYGRLAGLTSDDEAALVSEWLEKDWLFGPRMDQAYVDNQWQLIELMDKYSGTFPDGLPDKDEMFISWDELGEMADG